MSYSRTNQVIKPFPDECVTGSHNCSVNATCSNTESGFTCSCNSGFNGDGVTCDVEVCSQNCCTVGAVPFSMPSSDYECTQASFGVVVTKLTTPVLDSTAASASCALDGASVHLPTPKNAAENDWYNDYMQALRPTMSNNFFWIGINDALVEGRGCLFTVLYLNPGVKH